AASAGPAFEGSGVSCGMRASNGAIERVRIDPKSKKADVTVIGGSRPIGLCGSGMIDLLAELWASGLLHPDGKLDPQTGGDRVQQADGGRHHAYAIIDAADSDTGQPITIDEKDIQNLLRTKAAVYSACAIMLRSVGLDLDAVAEVYVAGGFGRFLDLEKSIMIGLLPDLPLDRFTYLGNAALTGAQAMLASADNRRRAKQLADRV
ncbi:MAG: ATP-binding protein, partial [Bradyrhizobium sp.]|nr:ATP-binding protein [Bradyrhizobium sp.]